jgi:hypothetical protein
MNYPRILALLVLGTTLVSCKSAQTKMQQGPVSISAGDVAKSYSTWTGQLSTPSALQGALQVKGTATMAPGSDSTTTVVQVNLSNVAPGGVHPWSLHRGQCGNDQGLVEQESAYQPISINTTGGGGQTATLKMPTPGYGNYFVVVNAAATNMTTEIACGNLAPPVK